MAIPMEILVTILVSMLGSTGLWAFITQKMETKSLTRKMLIGIGHDRIIERGMEYLERGDWITEDEYENLVDYLYKPYSELGGNGSAERVITEIKQLRIVKLPPAEVEKMCKLIQ